MAESDVALLVDTNVLVRYLTADDRLLALRAAALLQGDRSIVLSGVVLAECAFVLKSNYEMPRDAIVDTLLELVQWRNVEMLSLPKSLVLDALELCRGSNRVSFTDALLWAEARHASLPVATFDQRFPDLGIEVERLDGRGSAS